MTLKRVISILIVNLIIFNSLTYVVTYRLLKGYFKNLITEKKEFIIPESDLELIIIQKSELKTSVTFIEENEFIYDNKLYDVVKETETENEIYYYCIYDHNETKLDLAFLNFLNSEKNKHSKYLNILESLQNFFSDALNCINEIKFFNSVSIYNTTFIQSKKIFYKEIPSPPPKIFS